MKELKVRRPVDMHPSCKATWLQRLAEHHLSASAFLHFCLDAPVVQIEIDPFEEILPSRRRVRCQGTEPKVPDGDGRCSLCGMFENLA